MPLIDSKVPVVEFENTNQPDGAYNYTMRGSDYRNFSLQVQLTNASLKIYASNKQHPGPDGWVDFSNYFSSTEINSNRMLVQTSDLKVMWWKFEITAAGAGINKFNLYLNRFNKIIS